MRQTIVNLLVYLFSVSGCVAELGIISVEVVTHFDCLLDGWKASESFAIAIYSNSNSILISGSIPVDVCFSGRVVAFASQVAVVDLLRYVTQVASSVVQRIAIDVVDLVSGKFAFVPEPYEMGESIGFVFQPPVPKERLILRVACRPYGISQLALAVCRKSFVQKLPLSRVEHNIVIKKSKQLLGLPTLPACALPQ